MLHFGKVKKLHRARVLRDIANENHEEWLPESWNKSKKSAIKYGKQLNRVWNIARDPSVVHKHGFIFLISYFEYVMEPILHNAPWEIEYFRTVLDKAYEVLYTKQHKLWGHACYTFDQKHTMIRPIIEAFGESLIPTHEHSWVSHRYSLKAIEKQVDLCERIEKKTMVKYQMVLDRTKDMGELNELARHLLKGRIEYLSPYRIDTPEKCKQIWCECVVEAANLKGYRLY
jgi:hypothetical protein